MHEHVWKLGEEEEERNSHTRAAEHLNPQRQQISEWKEVITMLFLAALFFALYI